MFGKHIGVKCVGNSEGRVVGDWNGDLPFGSVASSNRDIREAVRGKWQRTHNISLCEREWFNISSWIKVIWSKEAMTVRLCAFSSRANNTGFDILPDVTGDVGPVE